MKAKHKPVRRPVTSAPRPVGAADEKKVASFMAKFFGVAMAAIIVLLIYFWAIGKFG